MAFRDISETLWMLLLLSQKTTKIMFGYANCPSKSVHFEVPFFDPPAHRSFRDAQPTGYFGDCKQDFIAPLSWHSWLPFLTVCHRHAALAAHAHLQQQSGQAAWRAAGYCPAHFVFFSGAKFVFSQRTAVLRRLIKRDVLSAFKAPTVIA